jgi:hypothetical protein
MGMIGFEHGYALLVGVGHTKIPWWVLPVSAEDARAIAKVLTDPNYCAYPKDDQHVRVLVNTAATKQAVLEGLEWLKARAEADREATVLVYFSGHGVVDAAGTYALVTYDYNPYLKPKIVLEGSAFSQAVRKIPAQRLLAIVDSCHAAGMAGLDKGSEADRTWDEFTSAALPDALLGELKQGEGRAIFTSSREFQKSYLRPDGALSLYAFHLVEALKGAGSQPGDSLLHILDIGSYVSKKVKQSAESFYQFEQVPWFEAKTENYAVSLLCGGKGVPSAQEQIQQTLQALRLGMETQPPAYLHRVQEFVQYYLGGPKRAAAFGGRDAELAQLDRWLEDPGEPPYGMLAAGAGRGKSALLVQWMHRVQQRGGWQVIFLPISVRFETALESTALGILAARLAGIFQEPLTAQTDWRPVCESYLRRALPENARVLVVLDGLDEAEGWQMGEHFFALEPPQGLRVLASARFLAGDDGPRGWLERLCWNDPHLAAAFTLGPLDRPGVAQVLASMGNPLARLKTDFDLAAELHRLSEGDPLLVGLYVESLARRSATAARLSPNDLRSLDSGLQGYLERWWEDQRKIWEKKGLDVDETEDQVAGFLDLLAVGLGPLSKQDIAEVCLAGSGLDQPRQLKRTVRTLERFVIGDGERQGFAFTHPRFRDYFLEQVGAKARRALEEQYLAYGRRELEALQANGFDSGAPPSAYVLQYYGKHLERSAAGGAEIYALVCAGWMQARSALEGTYGGFLSDVQRAWQRANAAGDLPMQIQCALCQSSIAAVSSNISMELLALALENQVLSPTQALVILRQIPNDRQAAEYILAVFSIFQPALQRELLAVLAEIGDDGVRAEALGRLAQQLSPDLLKEALQYARSSPPPATC